LPAGDGPKLLGVQDRNARSRTGRIRLKKGVIVTKFTRSIVAIASVLGVGAVLASGAAAVGARAGKPDKGVIYFAETHNANGITYAAGNGTDSLFGTEAVTYAIKTAPTQTGAVQVTARPVTTWTKTGTLTGTATATLTVGANGKATLTNGKVSETMGTGTLKGHSFTATYTGSGDATTGTYQIAYKGIFK
jgi:hypothetical protein